MPIQWSKKRKYDQFYALALILKVEGMHKLRYLWTNCIFQNLELLIKQLDMTYKKKKFDVQRIDALQLLS
jgi:hypothetical protein